MPIFRNRAGFALPMSILVVAVLTAALAAGFAAATSETTASAARRGEDRAFAIAQSGLEQFLARRTALCAQATSSCKTDPSLAGSDTERVFVNVPGGRAEVLAVKVRPTVTVGTTVTNSIWFIRSRGIDLERQRLRGGATGQAQRIVGVYAQYQTQVIEVKSSWMSLSGFKKTGTAGTITGVNECNPADSLPGIVAPKGEYSTSGQWQPQGDPPLDTSKTAAQLLAEMNIDWKAIRNGEMPADIIVPPSTFPTTTWFNADTSRWPTIYVKGNFSLPSRGRGILIVEGNLQINGSDMWDGIILVGGTLKSDGTQTVAGATITGLNRMLGDSTDASTDAGDDVANGTKTYVYSSCKVARATQGLRGYKALPNTWVDNLPAW